MWRGACRPVAGTPARLAAGLRTRFLRLLGFSGLPRERLNKRRERGQLKLEIARMRLAISMSFRLVGRVGRNSAEYYRERHLATICLSRWMLL